MNGLSPPIIAFLNADISDQTKSVFIRQLFIDDVISKAEFDTRVQTNPVYPTIVHLQGRRVLVLLPTLQDAVNRSLADIVLFAKNGLVSVLSNKYGPPGITLPIDKVYLSALINLQMVPAVPPEERPDFDDGFVGETDSDDFDPRHIDKPNIEPV